MLVQDLFENHPKQVALKILLENFSAVDDAERFRDPRFPDVDVYILRGKAREVVDSWLRMGGWFEGERDPDPPPFVPDSGDDKPIATFGSTA